MKYFFLVTDKNVKVYCFCSMKEKLYIKQKLSYKQNMFVYNAQLTITYLDGLSFFEKS